MATPASLCGLQGQPGGEGRSSRLTTLRQIEPYDFSRVCLLWIEPEVGFGILPPMLSIVKWAGGVTHRSVWVVKYEITWYRSGCLPKKSAPRRGCVSAGKMSEKSMSRV